MGLILSIETAVSVCSVAVHKDGQLEGLLEVHQANIHAQKLLPLIDSLLTGLGLTVKELSAIAVSEGPGSYTGLRIGVSTAKGLAFAHGLPLIGVGTLEGLAQRARPFLEEGDVVIPMIDARRMEVYAKVVDAALQELEPLAPVIIDENSFAEYLAVGRVFFVGDGVAKVQEVLRHDHARYLPLTNSAVAIGELAFEKYKKGQFVDLAYFEPNYLKEFKVLKSKKNPLAQ
ncbi:tRNA (adenosine(37)-N6)-threonylcarbamoyltransferase complex dimerization subunit type 1 TsaB [Echinicola pacifica]|uniref:tRNA (Adenosine(37)-N6)-threonylcarbamoyltransferase complex dimerization subunit type 1 TsaB n=1 Tax=Echinicola pacifica TaxID=346377 RepID=A0A918Q6F5_9BACT|nr:tRNA (adenosine(37)-N6)-threonylcarbamoyltransferase complex dimerization subunit type 1 TsaB [Echinicola pacifica]GGZ33763.1 tRNA (adenosine(37)-N6)-threonylcarbamoyltransferase complex dimerization subunit type 1 TsaB [Echinicola pacifica]